MGSYDELLRMANASINQTASSHYAQQFANAQMNAALNQMPWGFDLQAAAQQPISTIAAEAQQGLLIEGTARRIDAA